MEADIASYEIYRKLTSGNFVLLTTVSDGTNNFIDYGIQLDGQTMGKVYYKIRAKDNHPNYSDYTQQIGYNYSGINKIVEETDPKSYEMNNNYPNPFNPSTKITYTLPEETKVVLKVFDVFGEKIATLVNDEKTAGTYSVSFDASNLASGIYFYSITAGKFTQTKKMILAK